MDNQPTNQPPTPGRTIAPAHRSGFDADRIRQLFQDKRFVTFLTGGGVCLVLIIYYFIRHTQPGDVGTKPIASLNPNIPNAGDTTGLPSRSKMELAADAQAMSMPDQRPMERGLNAGVPGTLQPDQPSRGAADGYIYSNGVPREVYDEPDTTGPVVSTRPRKPAVRADPAEDGDAGSAKTREELEKQRKLLALLQEYKADKLKRQQEAQGRLLKPQTDPEPTVSSLNGPAGRNSFYGLQADMRQQQLAAREDSLSVTVKAMVFSDQTIVSGGRVSLRLLETIRLRGRPIPEGTRLYGTASFGGQRVNIAINQVQIDGRIMPMKLAAYDMDGLMGIYVPNVLAVEQGRQVIAQTGQSFNVPVPVTGSNVPALAAASAVQATLQGGRSLLSRKMNVQKATLKNNYYVLLK